MEVLHWHRNAAGQIIPGCWDPLRRGCVDHTGGEPQLEWEDAHRQPADAAAAANGVTDSLLNEVAAPAAEEEEEDVDWEDT